MKGIKKLVFILMVMIIPFTVNAKVVETDSSLVLKGNHNSSKLVLSNNLTNEAKVDGIGAFLGNSVTGKGELVYGGYAGNIVNISDSVEKDLFVAGNMITITNSALLNRDLYIAGNSVTINANVGRNLNIACSTITLGDISVDGNAYLFAEVISFSENTKINGTLTISEDTEIVGLNESMYSKLVKVDSDDIGMTSPTLKDSISSFIYSIVSNYVLLLVVLLVFAKLTKKIRNIKIESKEIGFTILKGFALLIFVPIVSIILMCTGLLSIAGLISLLLYAIGLYIGYLIALFVIGELIWKFFNAKENVFMEALIGVVVIKLLSFVPIIGGLVFTLTFFYGIGLLFILIKDSVR